MTLAEWLGSHRYRLLDLKRFGSQVQACITVEATQWLSPRWKTLPSDVVVTEDELAAWSRSDDPAMPRKP